MMGRQVAAPQLFYDFCLDDHVPDDHLLRRIDRFVDLESVRTAAEAVLQHDRPPLDRSRSDAAHADRGLLHGHPIRAAAVRGGSSQSRVSLVLPSWAWTGRCRITRPSRATGMAGSVRATSCGTCSSLSSSAVFGRAWSAVRASPSMQASLRRTLTSSARFRVANGALPRSVPMPAAPPASIWMCSTMRRSAPRARAFRSSSRRPTRRRSGPVRTKAHAFFAYATNYLIDLDHAVIVDVEATRAIRQAEVGASRTMIARTQDRFGLWPARLAADSAYGSAENLAWLVHERGIEPHIPVFDKSARTDGTFSRSDFAYDHKRDRYTCPAGKELSQHRRRLRCQPRRRRSRRLHALPRQQVRLRSLRAEAGMLPQLRRPAKSCARSTRAPATWRATSRRRTPI